MRVAVLLTPYNLAAIRRSTGTIRAEFSPAGHLSRVGDADVVIVDTEYAQLPPMREALQLFATERPYIGIALAGRLTRDFARDVTTAAKIGVGVVILSDFDSPTTISGHLRDAYILALPHRICWQLQEVLERMPRSSAIAVQASLTGVIEVGAIGDMVEYSGVSRSTFYRHLVDAGIEPKAIVRLVRFLKAARSIFHVGVRLELIAERAGYFGYYQFQKQVRALTGVNARTLRYHLDPPDMLMPILNAIVPASAGMPLRRSA